MQAIACQFNYSESTFITSMDEEGGSARIFLPTREIPFAGHPSLGTAFVLEEEHQQFGHQPRGQILLRLKHGDLKVQVVKTHDGEALWVMDQFPVNELGEFTRRTQVLDALGLSENHVIPSIPFLLLAPSDLPFLFIPVKNAQILQIMKPNLEQLKNVLAKENADAYVFALEGIDGGDVHARFFAPNSGISEDPATGSAQQALMTYLEKTKLYDFTRKERIIIEQGYEMGRPSKLYNEMIVENGKIKTVRTGGKVKKIARGTLFLENNKELEHAPKKNNNRV